MTISSVTSPRRSESRQGRTSGLRGGLGVMLLGFVGMTLASSVDPSLCRAQLDITSPPIDYLKATPRDAISRLQTEIDAGHVKLAFDSHFGFLPAVLEKLQVPRTSQALVFSKTSLQVKYISPRSPRAIYFNDDVYVGWVQGGQIEVSAVDPELGANFYLLEQYETDKPRFVRRTYECLQCHGSVLTRDVPGHVVRSVPVGPDGHLTSRTETFVTDQNSPFQERWGGWYVSGRHGDQRHMGNLFVRRSDDPKSLDLNPGANVEDLDRYFETANYFTPHSDIVALLVLTHQANLHNRLTRAAFLTRLALRDDPNPTDATRKRIQEAAEPVVRHMLFSEEVALTAPIIGSSKFTEEFAARGPRDGRGRSLRNFDLTRRLFQFPCSFLIYSEQFDKLPPLLKEEVYRQLGRVLSGDDRANAYAHVSNDDRQAIREILTDTKTDLPDFWPASGRK